MASDHHIHMVLDGVDWKQAIARHKDKTDAPWVHSVLAMYREKGYTYLRDGGDKWGVSRYARSVADTYGITYRTPLAPISRKGNYGAFIGEQYEDIKEYANLVKQHRCEGADFIKIMISGLMDFDRYGFLTQEGLPSAELRELIHIAHEEGFSVMAHANGARTVQAAAEAGVDSVEHGAYLDADALCAMQEAGTVWVPTVSTVGNLRGTGRFDEAAVCRILDSALENIHNFAAMGGLVALGTDAGAWSVPHGVPTEHPLLAQAGVQEDTLSRADAEIKRKF
ncbi:MAG: amidohydrolase family protein [Oscillospiraceae bacterium]|nr:amidohydrolase family protein [Oscillospiraceae bacterium]